MPRRCGTPSPWAGGWDQRQSWRAWLSTSLIVLTIWAVTSLASWEFHYFWPIWVIGPWGAVLLAQTRHRRRPGRTGSCAADSRTTATATERHERPGGRASGALVDLGGQGGS